MIERQPASLPRPVEDPQPVLGPNPWQREGVSIIPDDLGSLMPIVGQKELFEKLLAFKQQLLGGGADPLSGFFVLVGGWGVGKSRVGHELCLEAAEADVEWVVDGRGERVLEAGLAEGILPLFVRYSQVTDGPRGDALATETWIPIVAHRALSLLAETPADGVAPARTNQARLLRYLRTLLQPKGLADMLPALRDALEDRDTERGVRTALDILRGLGVTRLWLIVDEIEDITDVERDGLPDPDRTGIRQELLTVIPRVIKQEEVRQKLPEVSFLLLCNRSVGDAMQDIKALQRRTSFYDLQTNAFADVDAYFKYLGQSRRLIAPSLQLYPDGLREAAFFAANRNFGWFNVIMASCHEQLRAGPRDVPTLLRQFAETDPRGRHVFDVQATGPAMIAATPDRPSIIDLLYGQLPRRIGDEPEAIAPADAARLLQATHAGLNQPLFARAVELVAPPRHEITGALLQEGFRYLEGNTLGRPGEPGFDLEVVLDSLQTYAIALENPEPGRYLVFRQVEELAEQIRGLTPYEAQAEAIAGPLHRFLFDRGRVVQEGGRDREYLAPSFNFLLTFNRLNRRGGVELGYLRDNAANTRLEEAFRQLLRPGASRSDALLRGVAQTWNEGVVQGIQDARLKAPSLVFTATREPLALGAAGRVTLLLGSAPGIDDDQLLRDLGQLAPRADRPAHPIVVILEGSPERERDLHEQAERSVPGVAPFLIVRSFTPYQVEILLRQGELGRSYQPEELRTNLFMSGVGLVRQHLDQAIRVWVQDVEDRGLILRPIFFRRNVADGDLRILAKGYALMLGGRSYANLLQPGVSELDESERDLFKKRASEQVDVPARYGDRKGLPLFDAVGDVVLRARVPRSLVALLRQFGTISRSLADLEVAFLFEGTDPRPSDVLRHHVMFLQELSFVVAEGGGRYRRVSEASLRADLDAAEAWLRGEFAEQVAAIRRINENEERQLTYERRTTAEPGLDRARQDLADLRLAFDRWPEPESQRVRRPDTGELESLPFEEAFTGAVKSVTSVRAAVRAVFDADEARAFEPSQDALPDLDQRRAALPLWKRLRILAWFFENVRRLRSQLVERIDALRAQSDTRAPERSDGQKAFPTQVLKIPLDAWRAELRFSADAPDRTIQGLSSTRQSDLLGFHIGRGQYVAAWRRLETLERVLTGRNEHVAQYFRALDRWTDLSDEVAGLEVELDRWEQFFADAPERATSTFGLDRAREDLETFREEVWYGIRDQVDEAEGLSPNDEMRLLEVLQRSLDRTGERPGPLVASVATVGQSVLTTLQEEYKDRFGDLMSAYARIATVRGQDHRAWPDSLGPTYGATAAAFETLVAEAEALCQDTFRDVEEPSWRDYVALCGLRLRNGKLPDDVTIDRWAPVLRQKGLIKWDLAG